MNREIGSEFFTFQSIDEQIHNKNVLFLISGRTAIDAIIKDVKKNKNIKSALLPSYCCESMIVPFLDNGIEVSFYSVDVNGIQYTEKNSADIVLVMDYFGFETKEINAVVQKAKNENKIVIYDSTQKINGNSFLEELVDYSFCSYRKWFYCNFSKLKKHNGFFDLQDFNNYHNNYIDLRDKAADLKQKYINGEINEKSQFLKLYNDAEALLETDYMGYRGVSVKYDLSYIKNTRQRNAKYLIDRLSQIEGVNLWKKDIGLNDIPLFVPIIVESKLRDELKKYLVSKDIYCPVHWPRTSIQTKYSDLYDKELSLICDQRYEISDMKRIVDEIINFFDSVRR